MNQKVTPLSYFKCVELVLMMIELEDFPPDPAPVEESQSTALSVDSPATAITEPPVAAEDQVPKRKRGKRKVLRKTTKRDEKGYLGTA